MHYLNDLIQFNVYDLGELTFTNSIPEENCFVIVVQKLTFIHFSKEHIRYSIARFTFLQNYKPENNSMIRFSLSRTSVKVNQ
jgi:hypothetical protein